MSSGACTVQQTLTAEAASVLKHSLGLAWRRGHCQVTPLHVAATLLSLRTSLLRSACLKSRPHHQQQQQHQASRALELCFNVALNRLPTTPAPILHGQPSLSNALVAALKRAQAHQKRGCIEQQQQQQPILTIKVELEELIISILDDPSVSRVMREAGFSSTAVKNNIEDSSPSPLFHCYTTSPIIKPRNFQQTPFFFYPQKKPPTNHVADSSSLKEDIKLVFEVFSRKTRRNSVMVGDSTESLVSELTSMIERGHVLVPEEMKRAHFIKFYFSPMSLRFMKKEDVEKHVNDLKRRVDFIASGGSEGAIIYTGDLKWAVEENLNGETTDYSAVDHLVTEIGRLISDYNLSDTKVWLLATASYRTYLRCQMRQPRLEVFWALQAVSVPSGGLCLSLHGVHGSSSNYEKDVQWFNNGSHSRYPWWPSESSGLSYSTPISFADSDSTPNHGPDSVPRFRRQSSSTVELTSGNKHQSSEPNLDSLKNSEEDKEVKVTLALGTTCLGNHDSVIQMKLNVNGKSTPKSTNNKRKLEWGESNKTRTQRTRPSSHVLDLNMTADETDDGCGEFSPMSSDITAEPNVQNGFLGCIKTEDQHKEIVKGAVEETLGGVKMGLDLLCEQPF